MCRQSLPSAQASIESAGIWARGIAQAEEPGLATVADHVARSLLTAALRRTPRIDLVRRFVTVGAKRVT
jgi:hypothetical protein